MYGITAASDYPDTFQHADDAHRPARRAGPSDHHLEVTDAVTDTGQHTVVVNNGSTSGEVDLCYRASALAQPVVPAHAEVNAVSAAPTTWTSSSPTPAAAS